MRKSWVKLENNGIHQLYKPEVRYGQGKEDSCLKKNKENMSGKGYKKFLHKYNWNWQSGKAM